MNTSGIQYNSVDEYIAAADPTAQNILIKIRSLILNSVPGADESIAYGMPAYKLHGKPLVYFAAFSKHIGFYATPDGHAAFEPALSTYKRGKGSVQFPLDQPIPYDLIVAITKHNADNLEKQAR